MATLYAVIDLTNVKESKILHVCDMERAIHWGRIYAGQGRKVIAPALAGRAFTALESTLALQYLYWNTFAKTPPEDFGELVKACKEAALALPADTTDIRWLEREGERYAAAPTQYDEAGLPISKPRAPAAPRAPGEPAERPRNAGATQKVWDVADAMKVSNNGQIPERKLVIEECVRQGINAATASTQFSKWKNHHVRPDQL